MAEEIAAVESVLREAQAELLERWVAALSGGPGLRRDLLSAGELRTECKRFLDALAQAVAAAHSTDTTGPAWDPVREQLTALSRSRATQGFTPTETATFVFSLKQPLFGRAAGAPRRRRRRPRPGRCGSTTAMLDRLGLFTAEAYLRSREEVIRRQQDELIELSTPVVKLWEGVVAAAADRHAGQRPHPGRDGEPARAHRRDRLDDRDHRHHRASRRSTRSSPSTCSRPSPRPG